MPRKKKPRVNLEPFMPDGKTPRCQAVARSGKQCGRPATTGYDVCSVHGAGTRKRVQKGEKRPPGRPAVHGLYSERVQATLRALYEEVVAMGDLDSTDREVAMLKAVLWYLLEQAEAFRRREEALEALFSRLEEDPKAASLLPRVERLMREVQGYLDRLSEAAMRVVSAARMRADITAKTAQAKAAQALVAFTEELKAVLVEHLEPPQYEAILQAVERRVLSRAAQALPPPE